MTVSRDFVNHRKWSSYEESVEMFSRISNFDALTFWCEILRQYDAGLQNLSSRVHQRFSLQVLLIF